MTTLGIRFGNLSAFPAPAAAHAWLWWWDPSSAAARVHRW
jgi:hypothetical protein